jgi:Fic family protein
MNSKEPKAGRPKVAALLDAGGLAMDHVGVMAQNPGFSWEERVILDLDFDACHFHRDKSPGRWLREGDDQNVVVRAAMAHLHVASVHPFRDGNGRVKAAAARWGHLESLVAERGRPERLVIALEQSLIGRTERGSYGKEAGVSLATTSADFRRLLEGGLVDQWGRGKSTGYRASEELRSRVSRALESD